MLRGVIEMNQRLANARRNRSVVSSTATPRFFGETEMETLATIALSSLVVIIAAVLSESTGRFL